MARSFNQAKPWVQSSSSILTEAHSSKLADLLSMTAPASSPTKVHLCAHSSIPGPRIEQGLVYATKRVMSMEPPILFATGRLVPETSCIVLLSSWTAGRLVLLISDVRWRRRISFGTTSFSFSAYQEMRRATCCSDKTTCQKPLHLSLQRLKRLTCLSMWLWSRRLQNKRTGSHS